MITRISGTLRSVSDTHAILSVDSLDYEILLADFARRQLQGQIGKQVSLHTLHFMEGNPAHGRLVPRLIGFLAEAEREFFEMFFSVDGVGARKALRAMVRPVQDVAVMIAEKDAKGLTTLPGIGAATADRVVAKLHRKMSKFALLVGRAAPSDDGTATDVVHDTYEALMALGHSERDARDLVDRALEKKSRYKDVNDLLQAIYLLSRDEVRA